MKNNDFIFIMTILEVNESYGDFGRKFVGRNLKNLLEKGYELVGENLTDDKYNKIVDLINNRNEKLIVENIRDDILLECIPISNITDIPEEIDTENYYIFSEEI